MELKIMLDNVGLIDYQLTIKPYKGHNGLGISASVGKVENGFLRHKLFKDFFKVYNERPCQRVTTKAMQKAMDGALLQLENIKADAVRHYQSTD
jgi:hypothetical protein